MRFPTSLAIALALVLSGCGGPRPAERPDGTGAPLAVAAEAPKEAPWAAAREVSAGVEPWRRATPGTVLMGRVVEVVRHEGDRVAAGDVLARIDARDVRAREAQAEAGVAAARAMEENARAMRERMERLYARQAASKKNLDDAVAAHEAARANLRAAEEGAGAAKAMAGYADVRAPFAGTVTERRVEAGDIAAPGMPLFTVEDRSRMKVEAQVAESGLAGIAVGAGVEVALDAPGPEVRRGTLTEILPSADPASRTFRIRVLLDNADGALRSGAFARVRLAGAASPAARLSVAETAVVRRGPLTGVFVVDAGSVARLRYVALGGARDGRIEVLSGLDPSDRVVTSPPAALEDGRKVEVHG